MTTICILAGNYHEAQKWASANMLDDDQWFYPRDTDELQRNSNFHVIVIGTAGHNVPNSYFNRLLELAQSRGRINRE